MAKGAKDGSELPDDRDPYLVAVGERVRATRKRLKFKQSELAAAIGSGSSYIVQIEAGETNITLKMLVRVASALSVSPRDLLPFDKGEPANELLEATLKDLMSAADAVRQARGLIVASADNHDPTTPSLGKGTRSKP